MKTLKRAQVCALVLVVCLMTTAITVEGQTPEAKFDEYMTALVKLGRFNGYVLIARDGKQVFGKGYGMANFEDEVPNTSQTKFRLASVTKPFTATAILLLQEKGKLSLKDSVCQHLKNCPPAWKPVQIEQLLAHTSGIPDLPDALFTGYLVAYAGFRFAVGFAIGVSMWEGEPTTNGNSKSGEPAIRTT